MKIRRMRITCWVPKATNTYSGYVTLNDFSLQQWLHKGASMLRYTYTYTAYLVIPSCTEMGIHTELAQRSKLFIVLLLGEAQKAEKISKDKRPGRLTL
jgi:hypothetical protein